MPLKVMTIVGTRPEIIKLCRVIVQLDENTEHILVHTGQNFDYELNQIFFDDLGLRKPDHFLECAGESAAQTIGSVIAKTDGLLDQIQPDAVLLLGDTNSCLAAIAAKRRKIPVFHMEAGNRCFDQRVPEEINRKIVDHISDINMTYTEHARRYLIAEGLRPETIVKTGSPMKEVLDHFKSEIDASSILDKLQLPQKKYFIVSAHREENVDNQERLHDFLDTLSSLRDRWQYPIIVSTHPRTRKRLEDVKLPTQKDGIHFLKPLGFFDYINLQTNAFCTVSESGTITEESSILNFPAVTIRQAHERPEGMDEGTLIMCGLKVERVVNAVEVVTGQYSQNEKGMSMVADYNAAFVSQKVVRIILSYVDYINRTVWFNET
jgi:UDP-N-acetylglucosamine 2-epimerase (non-hydrolysing)